MSVTVVLDAAAFDMLDNEQATGLRALLRSAIDEGGEVRCAAVTLAEVCRGMARTRRVEAALARRRGGQRIRVVPTVDAAIVLTADPGDIARLAAAVPGTRIVTRSPAAPLKSGRPVASSENNDPERTVAAGLW